MIRLGESVYAWMSKVPELEPFLKDLLVYYERTIRKDKYKDITNLFRGKMMLSERFQKWMSDYRSEAIAEGKKGVLNLMKEKGLSISEIANLTNFMKSVVLMIILLSLFCIASGTADDVTKLAEKYGMDPGEMRYVPGELFVKYDTSAGDLNGTVRSVNAGHDLMMVKDYSELGLPGLVLVRFDPDKDPEEVGRDLMATGRVKYTSPNYVRRITPYAPPLDKRTIPRSVSAGDTSGMRDLVSTPLVHSPLPLSVKSGISGYEKMGVTGKEGLKSPDDRLFPYLWGMENRGQFGGKTGDIRAKKTWDVITGSRNVTVAVVDTGIKYDHPDLAGNIWTDPATGIHGYNFVSHTSDPMDDEGHGSHCAGTIGAVANNKRGVAGVCWNVRLMAIKVFNANGEGEDSDAINGILWARDHGADIISNSWGGYDDYNPALKEAIEASGLLNVCAAGNGDGKIIPEPVNTDIRPHYPASYDSPNIISVAATDFKDNLTWFSNYGRKSVDLGAPGVKILSCGINESVKIDKAVFYEPFTSLNNWTNKGFNLTKRVYISAPTGLSAGGDSDGNVRSMVLNSPVNCTGIKEPYLGMWAKLDFNVTEYLELKVSISNDKKAWKNVLSLSSLDLLPAYSWISAKIPGSMKGKPIYIRVEYAGIQDSSENSIYIDDLAIGERGDTSESYFLADGTSMSTPHVAGTAALVKALHPGYSAIQIRDAILSGVDKVPVLNDKLSTGGRLNAFNALGLYEPFIDKLEPSSGKRNSIIPSLKITGKNLRSGDRVDFVRNGSANHTYTGTFTGSGLVIRDMSLKNVSEGWYTVFVTDPDTKRAGCREAAFLVTD